jgi:hypothetical protein
MSTDQAKPNRSKRKGLPKSRLGCYTCKKRRVKCGQEKPACLRCIQFGVFCDGYAYDGTDVVGQKPAAAGAILGRKPLLLPKVHSSRSLIMNPSSPLFRDEKDHRYFDIFCTKTAFEILPCYDAGTFRQTLLQSCVSDPSLRHAVVALGALDMKMETLPKFKSLSLEEEDKSSHQHHLNSLEEYSKAISQMRVSTSISFLCSVSAPCRNMGVIKSAS